MADYQIQLFIFPDGMEVEMIVFDDGENAGQPASPAPDTAAEHPVAEGATAGTDETDAATAPAVDVHVCPLCRSDLVYPTDWRRVDRLTWELDVRCPNCELTRTLSLPREDVESFNRILYEGTEQLARTADSVTRQHFEEETDKFVTALQRGLIQPIDF